MFDQEKNNKKQEAFNILSIVSAPKPVKKPPSKETVEKIHPYLNNNNLHKQKLNQLNEKLIESTLTPQQLAFRRDIKKAKQTFVKFDKKNDKFRSKQPKKHKPQIIDLSQQKKTKKQAKTQRKQIQHQERVKQKSPVNLQRNNENRYDPLQIKVKTKQPQPKKKPFRQVRPQPQQQSQYEQDDFIADDDNDQRAKKQLSKMFKRFKSKKYLQRDNQQIPIESKVDRIFQENRISTQVGIYQDLMEQERQKKRHAHKKKHH